MPAARVEHFCRPRRFLPGTRAARCCANESLGHGTRLARRARRMVVTAPGELSAQPSASSSSSSEVIDALGAVDFAALFAALDRGDDGAAVTVPVPKPGAVDTAELA